jgi:hypothetical protein
VLVNPWDGCAPEKNTMNTATWRVLLAFVVLLPLSALLAHAEQTTADPAGSETVGIPAKVYRHAERLAARCDADGNGQVDAREWSALSGNPREADTNGDGALTVAELAQYIADYGLHRKIRLMPAAAGGIISLPSLLPPTSGGALRPGAPADRTASDPEASEKNAKGSEANKPKPASERKWAVARSRLPPGLPDWFLERDGDGDGQLTLAEYGTAGTSSADESFARYDRNHDGLLTPREVLGGK